MIFKNNQKVPQNFDAQIQSDAISVPSSSHIISIKKFFFFTFGIKKNKNKKLSHKVPQLSAAVFSGFHFTLQQSKK